MYSQLDNKLLFKHYFSTGVNDFINLVNSCYKIYYTRYASNLLTCWLLKIQYFKLEIDNFHLAIDSIIYMNKKKL